MELTYVTIVILASLIFVLAGMVGYLYWQQTSMLQHLQSLALALAAVAEQMRPPEEVEPVHVTKEDEDDRVTVKEQEQEQEEAPKTPTATSAEQDDVDDLQEKTSAELRDLLTKKGIPYGKRDSKSVLIQLLKATA